MNVGRIKVPTKHQKEANAKRTWFNRVTTRNIEFDPSQVVGDREPRGRCGTRADVGCVHRAGL